MQSQAPSLLSLAVAQSEDTLDQLIEMDLNSSGSTWENWENRRLSDQAKIVRAVDAEGNRFISSQAIGIAEMLCGYDIRKRMELGDTSSMCISSSALSDMQNQAAKMITSKRVSCLVGYPGTGKSYVLRHIVEHYESIGLRVVLCAPTGAAARRMSEATDRAAYTVHMLLEFNGKKFGKDDSNAITTGDVFVMDEVSMLSTVLHWAYLRAIPDDAILIYVGDPDQLPSVEAGCVLEELTKSIPTYRLTEVHRYSEDSDLATAAECVRMRRVPESAKKGEKGFFVVDIKDGDLIEKCIVAQARLAASLGIPRFDAITLSPTHHWRELYNAESKRRCREHGIDYLPIVSVANDYDNQIFNGDNGILRADGSFQFGDKILSRFRGYEPGFCRTVHRVQGREFPGVILMAGRYHSGRPNHRLVYTALTRGKSKFAFFGCKEWFFSSCVGEKEHTRLSLLSKFITGNARVLNR